MGIQDRDWYKDEYKRKMSGGSHKSFSTGSGASPDLSAFERAFAAKEKSEKRIKLLLLFILLCLATYGALAIVHHLKQPLDKQKPAAVNQPIQPTEQQQKPPPKPQVRYL